MKELEANLGCHLSPSQLISISLKYQLAFTAQLDKQILERSFLSKKGPATPTPRAMTQLVQTQAFAVAQATPLPTYQQPEQGPSALQKPQGYAGWAGFPEGLAQSAKAYCSPTCTMVGRVDAALVYHHVMSYLKGPQGPIEYAPTTSNMKNSQCKLCYTVDHTDMGNCLKFQ